MDELKELYKESIIELSKLENLPTWREWNKIAKEKCLMNCVSLKAFSGKNFNLLHRDARLHLTKILNF